MPPRPAKRPRADLIPYASPSGSRSPSAEASTSNHLLSFLNAYDQDESGSESSASEPEPESEVEPDPDEDANDTPTKRSRSGLLGVGTPSSARSTPRKRKIATPTPRKDVRLRIEDPDGEGIIKTSKSDHYFLNQSRSSKTSGASYSSLVEPLSAAFYEKYTSEARRRGKSKAIVQSIENDYEQRFPQWEMELMEGFNLVFYGFGSKRRVLNSFMMCNLANIGHVVIVNGHFPGLSMKEICNTVEDSLGISAQMDVPKSFTTALEKSLFRIDTFCTASPHPLFLCIHNIDAPAMKTAKSLAALATLVKNPNIHLVTSFDHLNAPLLLASPSWNWVYHNLTTFDDYDLELTYSKLSSSSANLASNQHDGISEESVLQILASVPPNAKRLFKLLLAKQVESLPPGESIVTAQNQVAPVYGIDLDILMGLAKEKFIAREEERFMALMGEFKDHGVVVEAIVDGEGRSGRWVWVPIAKGGLERILQSLKAVET
ncbi:origin recognition complex subunit 2, partial [Tremellales sp. Uapishka_1]